MFARRQFNGTSYGAENFLVDNSMGGRIEKTLLRTKRLSSSIYDGIVGFILVSMRSYDDLRYRRAAGYTDGGFRNALQLVLEAYRGGEQIIRETTLHDVFRDGDYAFLKKIEDRRLQRGDSISKCFILFIRIKLKYSTPSLAVAV